MAALLEDRVAAWVADHPGSTAVEIARGVRAREQSVREVLRGSGVFVGVLRGEHPRDKTLLWSLRIDAADGRGRPGTSHSQTARILAVLRDGRSHTGAEIHRRAGFSRLNSRIAELRRRGHRIDCFYNGDRRGGVHAYSYVLLTEPAATSVPAAGSANSTTRRAAA